MKIVSAIVVMLCNEQAALRGGARLQSDWPLVQCLTAGADLAKESDKGQCCMKSSKFTSSLLDAL